MSALPIPVTTSSPLRIKDENEITDEEITQHVVKTTFGFGDEKLQVIKDWVHYKGLSSFPDIVLEFLHDPGKIQDHTSNKKNGTTHDIHIATIKILIAWLNMETIDASTILLGFSLTSCNHHGDSFIFG